MSETRRPGELPPLPQAGASAAPLPPAPVPVAAASSADADPMIGQVIGDRYRIVERIGSGGMAIVYRAEHELLHKSMAVKLLLPELSAESDMIARFEREAVAAARLDHPNCVAITDFGRTRQGRLFLVMEYLDGHPLSEISGYGKRLPWERAVEIIRQVLRGLARAHETGIVHRDLKASNIMLVAKEDARQGREIAKIIDFGIAKIFDGVQSGPRVETQAGIVFGTADFLAPERLVGKGDTDPRSDIYSVGIILYEMITGARPFHDEDAYVIVRRALAEKPKRPAEMTPDAAPIPPELEATIMKALEKDPVNRHQSAREMLNSLDTLGSKASSTTGYLAGKASAHPVAARAELAPELLEAGRRRRAWVMWGGLIAVPILAISIGIAMAVGDSGDTSEPGGIAAAVKTKGGAITDADVAKLVKQAAEGDTVEARHRAFDKLQALGYVDRVPWLEMLTKDLAQLPTCAERREVVEQLRKLKDPKALPAIEAARDRADNDCLRPQAAKCIKDLGGDPPAPEPTKPASPAVKKKPPPPKKSGGGGHF